MPEETTIPLFAENRYDKMLYRRCGQSGLLLPAISLGALETFDGYRGEEIACTCIYRTFDLGITHFDLANNYGRPPGNAERIVGKIINERDYQLLIKEVSWITHLPKSSRSSPSGRIHLIHHLIRCGTGSYSAL